MDRQELVLRKSSGVIRGETVPRVGELLQVIFNSLLLFHFVLRLHFQLVSGQRLEWTKVRTDKSITFVLKWSGVVKS